MMMSFTSELTTAASATPMMNARARARTFALSRNSLNSDNIARNLHAYVAAGNQHAGCQGYGRESERYKADRPCCTRARKRAVCRHIVDGRRTVLVTS